MARALEPAVRDTMACVADALSAARDPWWIIGSAAVALHHGNPGAIADIDVLISRRDLDALNAPLLLTNTPEAGKDRFRSELFGRWSAPPLEVEFMAGLEVQVAGEWHRVDLRTRQAFAVGGARVYAPERGELVALLRRFGREKDLRRAAWLEGQD